MLNSLWASRLFKIKTELQGRDEKSLKSKQILMAILAAGILLCGIRFFESYRIRERLTTLSPRYGRVEVWISASECALKTGKFLVICRDGNRLDGIENVSLSDDPGHALTSSVIARIQGSPVSHSQLVILNMIINVAGLLSLGGLLWMLGLRWTCAGIPILAALYVIPGGMPGPDIVSSALGVFCFAMIPSVWMCASPWFQFSPKQLIKRILLMFASLGFAFLFREPLGLSGLVSLLFLSIFFIARASQKRDLFLGTKAAFIFLALLGTAGLSNGIYKLRDLSVKVQDFGMARSHGISHNLYLGLGRVPNKWGLEGHDQYGERAVRQVDPSVKYGSHRYYEVLWKLYFQRWQEDPIEVIRIYLGNILKILSLPLVVELGYPTHSYNLAREINRETLMLLILYMLTVLTVAFHIKNRIAFKCGLSFLLCAMALSLQGLLVQADNLYLWPLGFTLMLGIFCSMESGVRLES